MRDLCPCGCGRERAYPVGLTLVEAALVRRVLGRRRWHYLPAAKSLLAKIDHALASRSVPGEDPGPRG